MIKYTAGDFIDSTCWKCEKVMKHKILTLNTKIREAMKTIRASLICNWCETDSVILVLIDSRMDEDKEVQKNEF